MIAIKQLLNKIFWDKRENRNDYALLIYDRIEKKLVKIEFSQIEGLDRNFLRIKNKEGFAYIPLHRIKFVLKNNEVFWRRRSF
ncbi:MAG: DUF504 domain-containing protein [Candidatus Woesearchaeota archaeon]